MNSKPWTIRPGALLLLAAAAIAGCELPGDPGEHPVGAVFLRADGTEAARFVYTGATTGQLRVSVGTPVTYRVRLVDGNGNLRDVDGQEFSIRNPVVIIAFAVDAAVQGDQLVLTGRQAFATSVQLEVHHAGHHEFTAEVPIVFQ